MSSLSLEYFLLIAAVVLILPLAGYAAYSLRQLRSFNHQQRLQQAEREQAAADRARQAGETIEQLLRALLQQEMSLTEAAMRVSYFAQQLPQDVSPLDAFHQLSRDCSHIPILEAWQALSAQQREQFDRQRLQLEDACREQVLAEAQRWLNATADHSDVQPSAVEQWQP